jgi:cytochrome c-type biogenesis protein CcmH/NrfF
MTQTEMVLDYLKRNGSITQADAIREIGCYRLGARVYDLKQRGHDITRIMESTTNRYGATVSYARYALNDHDTQ